MKISLVRVVKVILGVLVLLCCSVPIKASGYVLRSWFPADKPTVRMLEMYIPTFQKYKVTLLESYKECKAIQYSQGYFYTQLAGEPEDSNCSRRVFHSDSKIKPAEFTDEVAAIHAELMDILERVNMTEMTAEYTANGDVDTARFSLSCFWCRTEYLYDKDGYTTLPEEIPNEVKYHRIEGTNNWLRRWEDWN